MTWLTDCSLALFWTLWTERRALCLWGKCSPNEQLHPPFIYFFHFVPTWNKGLSCLEEFQERGGTQHTRLETCCFCPRGRCVTSLSEPVSWWLVWFGQQGNAEGPVHGWRLGRKGEELSLFLIKSCSSLHGKKPFQCYPGRKLCTITPFPGCYCHWELIFWGVTNIFSLKSDFANFFCQTCGLS